MLHAAAIGGALGRFLMVFVFLLGAIGQVMAPTATKQYIIAVGLPLPDVAYVVAVAVELVGGLVLLVGFQTRVAAGALAVFSLVTAVAFHLHPADQVQMINFWKNLAIAGGFLMVLTQGGGALSVDYWLARRRAVADES